jgi:hypothetical protein
MPRPQFQAQGRAFLAHQQQQQMPVRGVPAMVQPSSGSAMSIAAQNVEDLDPDAWWPGPPDSATAAQDAQQMGNLLRTALTAAASGVVHSGQHHRRHKTLRHEPLDPATMLKLRQDLLAGKDVSSMSWQGGSPLPSHNAWESQESQEGLIQVQSSGGHQHRHQKGRPWSFTEITSTTFSWLGSSIAGAVDFICDGRCGGRNHKKTALIIN